MRLSFQPMHFTAKPQTSGEVQDLSEEMSRQPSYQMTQNGVTAKNGKHCWDKWTLCPEGEPTQSVTIDTSTCFLGNNPNRHPNSLSGNANDAIKLWEKFWDYGQDATITD